MPDARMVTTMNVHERFSEKHQITQKIGFNAQFGEPE